MPPSPSGGRHIPKPGGGTRNLGIPTVLDRFIEHALLQVLQEEWDPTFSERSDGFRPQRSAHQAVGQAQAYTREGYTWVVDIDLEKFFDRVNHDVLMSRVRQRVQDRRVVSLIHRFLKAGVLTLEGSVEPTAEGTPQGGPLSPLLANLRLDELDQELEKRGHRFVRYADDANIYVRSRQAGERVMASVTRVLKRKLRLKVNEAKSAVDRPWNRTFLGFTFTKRQSQPAPSEREGPEGVPSEGASAHGPHQGSDHPTDRGGTAPADAGLAGVLRLRRGTLAAARPGQVDPAAAAELPLEAMGPAEAIGSCEHAAWAGSWPGTRSSQPTARGV